MPITNDLPDCCPLRLKDSMGNPDTIDVTGLQLGMAFAIHMDSPSSSPQGYGIFMGIGRGFFLPHVTTITSMTNKDNAHFSRSPVSNFVHEHARKRCLLHQVSEDDWKKLLKGLPALILDMCGGRTQVLPVRKCSACSAVFANQGEQDSHKCMCPKCGITIKRKPNYIEHVGICNGPMTHCDACHHAFIDSDDVKNHRCQCPHCMLSYKRKPDYIKHIEECGSAEAIFMRRELPQSLPIRMGHESPYSAAEVLRVLQTWSIPQAFDMIIIHRDGSHIVEHHGELLRWDEGSPIVCYSGAEEDMIRCIETGMIGLFGLKAVEKRVQSHSAEHELKIAKRKIKALEKKVDELRSSLLDAQAYLRSVGCHELANQLHFT